MSAFPRAVGCLVSPRLASLSVATNASWKRQQNSRNVTHRFVELIQGQGSNDSRGEVATRAVELIDAMSRSAAQGGHPVWV